MNYVAPELRLVRLGEVLVEKQSGYNMLSFTDSTFSMLLINLKYVVWDIWDNLRSLMRASSSVRENTAPPLYKRYETTNGYMWCVDHGMDTVLHKYWLVVGKVNKTQRQESSHQPIWK